MKIKNRFYLGKKSTNIKDASDYLFNNRKVLKDILIPWDLLAENLKIELPANKLEYNLFVGHRSKWVRYLNNQCSDMEYPIYLNVIQCKGVQILTDDDAVLRFTEKRLTKQYKAVKETIRLAEGMECKFPEHKKTLDSFKMVQEDSYYSMIGRMTINKELSGILKALPETIK